MKIKLILESDIFNCHRNIVSLGDLYQEIKTIGVPQELLGNLMIYFIDQENDKVLVLENEDLKHALDINVNEKVLRFYIQQKQQDCNGDSRRSTHFESLEQKSIQIQYNQSNSKQNFDPMRQTLKSTNDKPISSQWLPLPESQYGTSVIQPDEQNSDSQKPKQRLTIGRGSTTPQPCLIKPLPCFELHNQVIDQPQNFLEGIVDQYCLSETEDENYTDDLDISYLDEFVNEKVQNLLKMCF